MTTSQEWTVDSWLPDVIVGPSSCAFYGHLKSLAVLLKIPHDVSSKERMLFDSAISEIIFDLDYQNCFFYWPNGTSTFKM